MPTCVEGRRVPQGRLSVLTLSIGVPPPPAKSPKLARSVGTDPADSGSDLLSCSPGSALQRGRAPRRAELPLDPPHSPGESKSQPPGSQPEGGERGWDPPFFCVAQAGIERALLGEGP